METIAYQRLCSQIGWFDTTIQFYVASTKLVSRKCSAEPNKDVKICDIFDLGLTLRTYNRLNHPISYYSKFAKHNVRVLYDVAICHLYDIYTNYLKMIVEEMHQYAGARILASSYAKRRAIKIYYEDIVSAGDFARVTSRAENEFFKGIQNVDSHKKLLVEISNIANITYDDNLWKDVNFYMRYRNQLVHNCGKADKSFLMAYRTRLPAYIRVGSELPLTKQVYVNACSAITAFCNDLDTKLLNANFVAARP